jgi:CRISPR system Cascade subunit CasE
MYLTRAFLDPASRFVRADARNPEGLHKTVMRAFPDDAGASPRRAHAILHRLDEERGERLVLLIQSRTRPLVERWPAGYVLDFGGDLDLAFSVSGDNPAIRNVESERAAFQVGRRFAFRLRANTTRVIDTKTGPDGKRRRGRRVPLRSDEERLRWLTRRAEAAGFTFDPIAVRLTEVAASGGHRANQVTVAGTLFDGVLVVRDVELFVRAVDEGIGRAKAYGFGLLSLAPAR